MANTPTIFQPLIDAINSTTIKTEVSINKDTKKIIYTAIGTLSAAIVISAILNYKKTR